MNVTHLKLLLYNTRDNFLQPIWREALKAVEMEEPGVDTLGHSISRRLCRLGEQWSGVLPSRIPLAGTNPFLGDNGRES